MAEVAEKPAPQPPALQYHVVRIKSTHATTKHLWDSPQMSIPAGTKEWESALITAKGRVDEYARERVLPLGAVDLLSHYVLLSEAPLYQPRRHFTEPSFWGPLRSHAELTYKKQVEAYEKLHGMRPGGTVLKRLLPSDEGPAAKHKWQKGTRPNKDDPRGFVCKYVTAKVDYVFKDKPKESQYLLAIAVGFDRDAQTYTVWDPQPEVALLGSYYNVPKSMVSRYPQHRQYFKGQQASSGQKGILASTPRIARRKRPRSQCSIAPHYCTAASATLLAFSDRTPCHTHEVLARSQSSCLGKTEWTIFYEAEIRGAVGDHALLVR